MVFVVYPGTTIYFDAEIMLIVIFVSYAREHGWEHGHLIHTHLVYTGMSVTLHCETITVTNTYLQKLLICEHIKIIYK